MVDGLPAAKRSDTCNYGLFSVDKTTPKSMACVELENKDFNFAGAVDVTSPFHSESPRLGF
jgi:hypothetical protein